MYSVLISSVLMTSLKCLKRDQKNSNKKVVNVLDNASDIIITLSFLEAKRSQSISNCVHLSEALPATKSVPLLLHTVSALLPGLSYSSCSHRLSGTVTLSHVSIMSPSSSCLPLGLTSFVNTYTSHMGTWPLHLC